MNHKNHSMKHMFMMILCCALPILAAAAIPFLGTANSPFKTGLAAITPFMCPIMMVIMMFMMRNRGGSCHGSSEDTEVKKLNK